MAMAMPEAMTSPDRIGTRHPGGDCTSDFWVMKNARVTLSNRTGATFDVDVRRPLLDTLREAGVDLPVAVNTAAASLAMRSCMPARLTSAMVEACPDKTNSSYGVLPVLHETAYDMFPVNPTP